MNIHNINISFVITAIKSTWFYLRNNSSPILDLQDIKRVSLHWNKEKEEKEKLDLVERVKNYEIELVAIKPSLYSWNWKWKNTLTERESCPFQVPTLIISK